MSDAINFNQVSKRYGDQHALRSVTFTVPSGAVFGLVGLNGAGKTTLIKCLLDFTFPDSGDVHIYSLPATDALARRPLAYLPERFIPPSYLTGLDYLQMMSRMYGVTPASGRIEAAAAAIDLDPKYLAKRVSSYSKGSGQKLGIGDALQLVIDHAYEHAVALVPPVFFGRENAAQVRAIRQPLLAGQTHVLLHAPQQIGTAGHGLRPHLESEKVAVGQAQHAFLQTGQYFF